MPVIIWKTYDKIGFDWDGERALWLLAMGSLGIPKEELTFTTVFDVDVI